MCDENDESLVTRCVHMNCNPKQLATIKTAFYEVIEWTISCTPRENSHFCQGRVNSFLLFRWNRQARNLLAHDE